MRTLRFAAVLFASLLAAQSFAQVVIWPDHPPRIPRPPRPMPPPRDFAPIREAVELRELAVDARVRDQAAEVRLSQTFYNPNGVQMEAQYLFPVPEGSAVQDFTLMVDGQELAGELMDADKARGIYEEIVRRQRDPGLLEWAGRGLLKTSVFPIPARSERTVTLRYTSLLPKDGGRIDLQIPLGAPGRDARRADRLNVEVRLENAADIKTLYSPQEGVQIRRDGDRRATARLEQRNAVPPAELRLVIGLGDDAVGATLLSTRPSGDEDGYFLLLASPSVEARDAKPLPKTVVFVLDRSGSMSGKKMEQARGALRFVMENLRDDDTFNIVAYDDQVEAFRPELQRYDAKTRGEALEFVENIRPGGSTNIDEALRRALELIPQDRSRPAYVIFLTDGIPTAGEKNEGAIADRAKTANKSGARVFAFGVGYDLNSRLLDRLSGGNGGATEFVKPEDDIEASVGRFYGKIASPVLSDIKIELAGKAVNRLQPRATPDLFRGGQLVLAGRYRESGDTTIRMTGRIGDEAKTFEFPARLVDAGRGSENAFVERLWATRRIGELIDEIDMRGKNPELIDELVALSKRYGILTPYTSFLAQENVNIAVREDVRRFASDRLEQLNAPTGAGGDSRGVELRAMKGSMAAASAPAAAATYYPDAAVLAPAPDGIPQSSPSVPTMRQAGGKAFYKRGNVWIDAEALERDAAGATTVKAFSDAWFALARSLSGERAQWLDFAEPALVVIDGKLYRIEPEESSAPQ